jgi:hypothetical protein
VGHPEEDVMKKALFLVALALCVVVAGTTVSIAEEAEKQPDPETAPALVTREDTAETRIVELEHVDTKTAITALRAIYGLRRITEIPSQRMVVFREDPEIVAAAARMLEELDVAPVRWAADLVLVTGSDEQVVRRLDLEREELRIEFNNGKASGITLDLDAYDLGSPGLRARYRVLARLTLRDDQPGFTVGEQGTSTFEAGDELVVVEASRPDLRQKLAETLGHDGQANALVLRFRKR